MPNQLWEGHVGHYTRLVYEQSQTRINFLSCSCNTDNCIFSCKSDRVSRRECSISLLLDKAMIQDATCGVFHSSVIVQAKRGGF